MKNYYQTPTLENENLEVTDVITASGEELVFPVDPGAWY